MGLGRYFGVPKPIEILFLSFFGICSTIFDAVMMDLNSNVHKIWDMHLDSDKFSARVELYSKYILTAVVIFRTFTMHLYLGCYFVLLYPTIFEERPGLILPWIFVNATKCILTGLICITFGLYTCLKYSFRQPACWEFMITRFMEQTPSIYMFLLVLSFYRDLKERYNVVQFIGSDDLANTLIMDSFETLRPSVRYAQSKASMSERDSVSRNFVYKASRTQFHKAAHKEMLLTRSCPEFTDYDCPSPAHKVQEESEVPKEIPATVDTQTEKVEGLNAESQGAQRWWFKMNTTRIALGAPKEQEVPEVETGKRVRRTTFKNDGYTQSLLDRN